MGLDELALCVRKENLPSPWQADGTVLPIQWPDLDFLNGLFEFHCRRDIETDFTWKQIIPYALSITKDNRLLVYQRHGTEKRLHGLWSAGIGGHINQDDAHVSEFREILMTGMKRECQEELGIPCQDFSLLGVINEEQTAVGHAHIGIVFVSKVEATIPASSELKNWKFIAMDQWVQFHFELWSSMAIRLYDKVK